MSDDKVVRLDGKAHIPAGEPDQALISGIKSMLAKAEAGELRCLVATGFTADGSRLSFFGGSTLQDNVYAVSGALSWLQREYEDRVLDKA